MLATVQESDRITQGWLAGFQRRLAELGWSEDRNIRLDRRWAGGDPERMSAHIADMDPLLSAAATLGIKIVQLDLQNEGEIDGVIAAFATAGGNGLIANSDAFMTVHRARIIAATGRHRLPAMFSSAARAAVQEYLYPSHDFRI